MITEKIQSLLEETAALTATTAKEVEDLRIHYLGRKGVMNDLMAEFRELPQETKREETQPTETIHPGATGHAAQKPAR